MARYSYTPKKWCTSATKLIYKPNKTDPHYPSNYRPIALINYILKLWTYIFTSLGTQTTEFKGIFSDNADGFRSHINIYDSLSTHIMMYEDVSYIHSIFGFQGRLGMNGPPNTLLTHDRIWIPRLLHCSVLTTILCIQHLLHAHTRQHRPIYRDTLQGDTPSHNFHRTSPKMASCRQSKI